VNKILLQIVFTISRVDCSTHAYLVSRILLINIIISDVYPAESDPCRQPLDSGHTCEEGTGSAAYFYIREFDDCEPFFYTGCGGNDNRFQTLKQCSE